MSQIVELSAVPSLPEEIKRDADNVVNNDESLEDRVESSLPAYKKSEGEVEFHRESKHRECSVGDEVFEETLLIPSALISQNTELRKLCFLISCSAYPNLPQNIDISDKNTDMM